MSPRTWTCGGLQCVAQVSPAGIPCGYVGVPAGHPWYGRHYADLPRVAVHGGLTFSGESPPGHRDNGLWWLGFDFGHVHDEFAVLRRALFGSILQAEDVSEEELVAETERLALQASEAIATRRGAQ